SLFISAPFSSLDGSASGLVMQYALDDGAVSYYENPAPTTFDGTTPQLLRAAGDFFGGSLIFTGDKLVAAAPGQTVVREVVLDPDVYVLEIPSSGAVYVIDPATGVLEETIINPHMYDAAQFHGTPDTFGGVMGLTGNGDLLIANAVADVVDGSGVITAVDTGAVYLYSA